MVRFVYWIESRPMVLLLAISSVFTFFWLMRFKERLRLRHLEALLLSILHVIVGVIAVSLFALLENPKDYSFGVQSLFGGVFFMPLVYWIWAKTTTRDCRVVFDTFAVCLIFTLMCARINCLISGCCLGKVIPGTEEIRWPTRELEILFYIMLMLIFVPKVLKGKNQGKIYPIYMLGYGFFRFVIETFRTGNGLFHLSHVWALISFCVGAGFLFEQTSKGKRGSRG